MEDMTTSEGTLSEIEENIPLRFIMDKLNAMEARIEHNFTQVHSQMGELRYKFKQQIDGEKEFILARNSEPSPPAKRDETLPYALFLFIGKCMEMIV